MTINKIRGAIKRYFGFSKAETNGFLVLLPMMVVIMVSNPLYRWFHAGSPPELATIPLHQSNPQTDSTAFSSKKTWKDRPKAHQRFSFDPNTISPDSLELLGFSRPLAERIVKFRSRGGKFYKNDDLQKIYGLPTNLYKSIEDLIIIPRVERWKKTERIPEVRQDFDINLADTTQLKSIRGIGSKLALRIIKFRDRLGGFTSLSQISEVYGLDSTVVAAVASRCYILTEYVPERMALNDVSEVELGKHPYLSKSDARIIATYRLQHGKFGSLDDLNKIHGLSAETIRKILPYLSIDK